MIIRADSFTQWAILESNQAVAGRRTKPGIVSRVGPEIDPVHICLARSTLSAVVPDLRPDPLPPDQSHEPHFDLVVLPGERFAPDRLWRYAGLEGRT